DLFAERMDRELPQAKGWFRSRVVPMTTQLAGDTRRPLLLLAAAVGVVLLIVCANVANLLLARSIVRTRALTMPAALGATRGRLIRQLLTEHVLLAALGGAAGLVLANIGVDLVKTFGPADVPRLADARVDVTVLLFSIASALVSGLLCGAAPAFAATRT